jgi:hypothetical protein
MLQTIEQIVSNMKRRSLGSVVQGPCEGGWVTCWIDDLKRVWVEFREDCGEGEKSILHPKRIEFDPHAPKIRKPKIPKPSKYNFCTYKRIARSKAKAGY